MADGMMSRADRRYSKEKPDEKPEPKPKTGERQEKPGQEGKTEKPEPKREPKVEPKKEPRPEAEDDEAMGEMMKRHMAEREMLAKHHEKERLDLHGQQRDEHRLMREKHDDEMKEMHKE